MIAGPAGLGSDVEDTSAGSCRRCVLNVAGTHVPLERFFCRQPLWFLGRVGMRSPKPIEHYLFKLLYGIRVAGRNIRELSGVALQIEQPHIPARRRIIGFISVRAFPLTGAENQLPPVSPHECFLVFQVFAENMSTRGVRSASFQIRAKTLAVLDGQ